MKGQFSQKRSVQKHYEMVHKRTWKPTLPGPDRAVIAAVNGEMRATEGAEWEQDTEMGGRAQNTMVGGETEPVTDTPGSESKKAELIATPISKPNKEARKLRPRARASSRGVEKVTKVVKK